MPADQEVLHPQSRRRSKFCLRRAATVRARVDGAAQARTPARKRLLLRARRAFQSTCLCLLFFEPEPDGAHNILLLGTGELAPLGNTVPLFETSATTSCCSMLRDKNRMTLERRLLPVICWKRGSETPANEISSMVENSRHPFPPKILELLRAEREVMAKGGAFEGDEKVAEISHSGREITGRR